MERASGQNNLELKLNSGKKQKQHVSFMYLTWICKWTREQEIKLNLRTKRKENFDSEKKLGYAGGQKKHDLD